MSTPLSEDTMQAINVMSDDRFALLRRTLVGVGNLATDAEAHLSMNVAAKDKMRLANDVAAVAFFIDDELSERLSSTYHAANDLISSTNTGLHAIGIGLMLKMISDDPALLQLAVQRLHDEYCAVVFAGEDPYARDFKAWRR